MNDNRQNFFEIDFHKPVNGKWTGMTALLIISAVMLIMITTQSCSNAEISGKALKTAKKGDFLTFGRYPQTADGGVKPIKWRVLKNEGTSLLVISEYALDAKRFDLNSDYWQNSEIKKWLNDSFLHKAFSLDEINRLETGDYEDARLLSPDKGENDGTEVEQYDSNNRTNDKVWLLSVDEAEEYFSGDYDRICKPTDYAINNHAFVEDGNCYWWLRTPISERFGERDEASVFYVRCDGRLIGNCPRLGSRCVRPVIRIKI